MACAPAEPAVWVVVMIRSRLFRRPRCSRFPSRETILNVGRRGGEGRLGRPSASGRLEVLAEGRRAGLGGEHRAHDHQQSRARSSSARPGMNPRTAVPPAVRASTSRPPRRPHDDGRLARQGSRHRLLEDRHRDHGRGRPTASPPARPTSCCPARRARRSAAATAPRIRRTRTGWPARRCSRAPAARRSRRTAVSSTTKIAPRLHLHRLAEACLASVVGEHVLREHRREREDLRVARHHGGHDARAQQARQPDGRVPVQQAQDHVVAGGLLAQRRPAAPASWSRPA